MNAYIARRVVATCAVAGSMLMAPTESHAIFHWFGGCSPRTTYRPYTATYAPAAVAPACAPCAQTCTYMPQTAYRTVYEQVPVTSYQPVAACDACGNRVTAMRPVVTYQTQARLVPYTAYRPVYAPAASYTPAVTSYAPAASSGCSTCNGAPASYTTPTYSQPVYSGPAVSAPVGGSPVYGPSTPTYSPTPATGVPGSSVPSLGAPQSQQQSPSNDAPRTFREDSSVTEPESRLRPVPDLDRDSQNETNNHKTNSTLVPRLLNPDDRTTYLPGTRAASVIPVSAEEPAALPATLPVDAGWRAARR